jgi:hypothetical protein
MTSPVPPTRREPLTQQKMEYNSFMQTLIGKLLFRAFALGNVIADHGREAFNTSTYSPFCFSNLRRRKGNVLLAFVSLFIAIKTAAVTLDDENRLTVVLKDGTQVSLLGEASSLSEAKTSKYYYLPTNLRIANRPDGTPEFLFLKYTTEQGAEKGGLSGGLVHFLMGWGLTPAQESELREKLLTQYRNAELKGAVPMIPEGDAASFQIVSATLSDSGDKEKGMTRSLVTSGKAPLVPGGLAAVAARMSQEGTQLLAASLEKTRSIADISLNLNMAYEVLTPAAKGRITFNWEKLEKQSDTLHAEYQRRQTGRNKSESCFFVFCSSSDQPEYTYSYDEVRSQFDFLREKEIVKFDFDEQLADERVTKIREAFTQYFINTMAQPAQAPPPPPPANTDKDKDKGGAPDIRKGAGYHYRRDSFKQAFAQKTKVINLNYRIAIRRPYQLVGNLATWYDAARSNPKCVGTVVLNDPFYRHLDLNFILSSESVPMFDSMVNYVTVNVRKNRGPKATPFEDRVTIDAKFVKANGVRASMSYSRGDDTEPANYEYQSQWSFKGGRVFPASPAWTPGSLESVTLSPPIKPHDLQVEADLEAMKANGIVRIQVQVHYPQFGEEREDNISISAAQNQPSTTATHYSDSEAKGYAYRVIFYHKTEGRLALPWQFDNAYYVYAAIPAQLLTQTETMAKAKEAGANIALSPSEKVLERFKGIAGEQ